MGSVGLADGAQPARQVAMENVTLCVVAPHEIGRPRRVLRSVLCPTRGLEQWTSQSRAGVRQASNGDRGEQEQRVLLVLGFEPRV